MTTRTEYRLSNNLDQYTIHFDGWIGKHNIHDTTSAHTHPLFVQWLINAINEDTIKYDVETEDEDLHFVFYGQEVIDQAPFFIGEKGNEARGFKLVAHQVIDYTIETDEESIAVITNSVPDLVEEIEEQEELFGQYLMCLGLQYELRKKWTKVLAGRGIQQYTYVFPKSMGEEHRTDVETQLYGAMADTLLEWTQWYDEWTFTDGWKIDTEGRQVFTWVFTHPTITESPQPTLVAV